jgi:hypothetical protein
LRLSVSAEAEKRHAVYPGAHFVPRTTLVTETLDWLDHHVGQTTH